MRSLFSSLVLSAVLALPALALAELPKPGVYTGTLSLYKCTNCDYPKRTSARVKLERIGGDYFLTDGFFEDAVMERFSSYTLNFREDTQYTKACYGSCSVAISRSIFYSTKVGFAEGCIMFCDGKYSSFGYKGKLTLKQRRR